MYRKITTNGKFDNGFTDWVEGADWSVVSEKAVWQGYTSGASSTLYQEISVLNDGAEYEIWFTLSGIVWQGPPNGYVEVSLGSNIIGNYAENGNYKINATAGGADNQIKFVITESGGADSVNLDKVEIDDIFVVFEENDGKRFPLKSFTDGNEEILKIIETSEYQG